MNKALCPICKDSEHLIQLAVDLGEARYESVNLCTHCHSVFGFRPLKDLGPVVKIQAVNEELAGAK